jgi:PBP1b-binding outer membrane lipoprotein LpoB
MKTAIILLLILALGLVITGCTKMAPAAQANNPANTPATDTANSAADIVIDNSTTSPDIGTLDNTTVSDEIPE